ncbi:MAG: HNH endonuclease [Anaerolineae bacterium]
MREQVLRRDHYRCQRCGKRMNLHVHHKKPVSRGGKDELSNLITLCDECHAKQHPRAKGLILSSSRLRRSRPKKRGAIGCFSVVAIVSLLLVLMFVTILARAR